MKKSLLPSIVLYIFAVIMAVYSIWSIIYCADIVSRAIETGQLVVSGYEYDIVSFYFNSCGQYVAFALLSAAAGLLLQRLRPASVKAVETIAPVEENAEDAEDNELDEWLCELDTDIDISSIDE